MPNRDYKSRVDENSPIGLRKSVAPKTLSPPDRSPSRLILSLIERELRIPIPSVVAERLLHLNLLEHVWQDSRNGDGSIFDRIASVLGINWTCSMDDLRLVPTTGPAVVVSNHPHGFVDGVILGSLLRTRRSDIKVLSNSVLASLPELGAEVIAVDPFGRPDSHLANISGLRQALAWLRNGSMLVIFPSGEVSRFRFGRGRIDDPIWNEHFVKLSNKTSAKIVPVFIDGANSLLFNFISILNKRLSGALLVREFLNMRNTTVSVRIGHPGEPAKLPFLSNHQTAKYFQFRSSVLSNRPVSAVASPPRPQATPDQYRVNPELLETELRGLPPESSLGKLDSYELYVAPFSLIPHILREIGRLREVSFRGVGEGTGQAVDLDRFDTYYDHLFAWDGRHREVAGAYRLAFTDHVPLVMGKPDLYTTTLFDFSPKWWSSISPAVELGRSFIRPEHQRNRSSLLALWRGIGTVVQRNPQYRFLFGAVSISNRYSDAAKHILMSSVLHPKLGCAAPRGRNRPVISRRIKRNITAEDLRSLPLDEIDSLVRDVDYERKGIPVLLKHYLHLGGQVLAYNLDRNFSNAVDGLLIVDLLAANKMRVERQLGQGLVEKVAKAANRDVRGLL